MITKQMLARCQNELKQAFCALDQDVQSELKSNYQHMQYLNEQDKWTKVSVSPWPNCVYRLSPDTPTEQEYEEFPVYCDNVRTQYRVHDEGKSEPLMWAATTQGFLGIIYRDKDVKETLRTSVDAAFGVPVRVRFAKD